MFSRGLRIATVLIALFAVVAGIGLSLLRSNTIYPGVRVAEVDLGGLTQTEAENKLAPVVAGLSNERMVLRYADQTFRTTFGKIGGEMDVRTSVHTAYSVGREGNVIHRIATIISVRRNERQIPITYSFNKSIALDFLRSAADEIDRKPVDAALIVEGDSIRITPQKSGIKLDMDRSLHELTQAANSGDRDIRLVVVTDKPKLTESDFQGIDGVVASYSTRYKPWERDRSHNLRIACRAINGTLVKPGGIFSYNKEVGPRTKELGFRDAPIFVDGQVEPGTGGGICQVSTTLYNAVLLADMKIVRRSHHSRPVAYAPVGRDATVAFPVLDFKFQNTSDTPIYVLASAGANTMNVSLLGAKESVRDVELVSEGHTIIKAGVTRQVDETLDIGKSVVREKGRSGHRVSIYRIVKQDGKVIKRELISRDYYAPGDKIIAVPKPVSEPTSL